MHIDLTNDYSDDTDLVLASVDIGVRRRYIGNEFNWPVIDRMNETQVIVGAKKVKLLSNIERLSRELIQTQIARGRICNADATGEASLLAKQQILAGAAPQMISIASPQKRSLVNMLF